MNVTTLLQNCMSNFSSSSGLTTFSSFIHSTGNFLFLTLFFPFFCCVYSWATIFVLVGWIVKSRSKRKRWTTFCLFNRYVKRFIVLWLLCGLYITELLAVYYNVYMNITYDEDCCWWLAYISITWVKFVLFSLIYTLHGSHSYSFSFRKLCHLFVMLLS